MLRIFCAASGYLQLAGDSEMTDRGFYLLLTFLLLGLAAAEIVYAMVGPLSAPTQQVEEISISRVR
jgi:hypothetical protein